MRWKHSKNNSEKNSPKRVRLVKPCECKKPSLNKHISGCRGITLEQVNKLKKISIKISSRDLNKLIERRKKRRM